MRSLPHRRAQLGNAADVILRYHSPSLPNLLARVVDWYQNLDAAGRQSHTAHPKQIPYLDYREPRWVRQHKTEYMGNR